MGTAETRHTPPLPYLTVAWPPSDWMVWTPTPPCSQYAVDPETACRYEVAVGEAVAAEAVRGVGDFFVAVRVGAGRWEADTAAGVLAGAGLVARTVGDAVADGETKTVGAERATGGVGLVEPTTKWTVRITAVTLAAVQVSHMSR